MFCSQRGNISFPTWEYVVPNMGTVSFGVPQLAATSMMSKCLGFPEVALHIYVAIGLEGDVFGL